MGKKRTVLVIVVIVAIVLVVVTIALIFILNGQASKENNQNPSLGTSSNVTDNASISDEISSSWKTYSNNLITLKYPDGWSIKQDEYVGGENFNIIPPENPTITGYFGIDSSTTNAKNNDSKTYWQRAYNSDNLSKIVSENSDSVNGYDTYNVEVRNSESSKMYNVIGKDGLKITFYYPVNDKNNDTYEMIVKTLRIN